MTVVNPVRLGQAIGILEDRYFKLKALPRYVQPSYSEEDWHEAREALVILLVSYRARREEIKALKTQVRNLERACQQIAQAYWNAPEPRPLRIRCHRRLMRFIRVIP